MELVYTTGVPSRIGGVSELTLADGPKLVRGEVATVTKFKNVVAYGVQSIALSDPAQKLMAFYMNARQAAVRRGGKDLNSARSPLWVSYDGSRMTSKQLGGYVTTFFAEKCNLQVSSDTCRALIETFAHREQLIGHVSVEERASITALNNHSSETVKNYYLMQDGVKTALLGAKVMKRFIPLAQDDDEEEEEKEEEEEETQGHNERSSSDIGSKHSISADAPRAKWDKAELRHLRNTIEEVREGYRERGVLNPTLMRDCLMRILQDERARPIFHCRHVLTSARLRAGFEVLMKSGQVKATGEP